MDVNKDDSRANSPTHRMQSQAYRPIYDNAHGNLETANSGASPNTESSISPVSKSSNQKSPRGESLNSSRSTASTSTAHRSHQLSRKHSYSHSITNIPNNQSTNLDNPTTPNIDNNHFLLQQQLKLTQLHQLQQLQHHIFQQQMALISGQPTSILPGSTSPEFVGLGGIGGLGNIASVGIPIDLSAVAVGRVGAIRPLHDAQQHLVQLQQGQNQQQQSHDGEAQNGPHTYSGLPTPAPSGEIRPMDYNTTSPMMNLLGSLNMQNIEPLPNSIIPSNSSARQSQSNSNLSQGLGYRKSNSLSSSSIDLQNNHQTHASYPSSPLAFNPNAATSPTFHPISPTHIPISHPYLPASNSHQSSSHLTPHLTIRQVQTHPHSYPPSSTSTPVSAPPSTSEKIAFSIYGDDGNRTGGSVYTTPHLHPTNSVHTSPNVLGSAVASISVTNVGRGFGNVQQIVDLDLEQDISPLTSPWLGATVAASGGTAVATSVSAVPHAGPKSRLTARRTSISGNKRTASDSGDEGGAWRGTNRNSRKRPVLGTGGRAGSFTGSVGPNAAAMPGLVGFGKEKGREIDCGKSRDSTSPLGRNSTSPASEAVSSPVAVSTMDPPVSGRGGSSGSGHSNGGSSQARTTSVASTPGSSVARRTRGGSRSASTTNTPLLRSTPSSNLLSPTSPVLAGARDVTTSDRREGRSSRGRGQGQELKSPSPVDLNLVAGQSQDGKSGRSMPPPPLPRNGTDVDMNSTEATSPMDDSSGHLRHGMLGMGFESMMSLDDGMSGMVGIGMGALGMGEMGMGLDGMDMSGISGMGSMGGIGSMEGMVDMSMGVNMGGLGGFGSQEQGIMGMDYGRDHDEEGINVSSSTSSTARADAAVRSVIHQHHRSQSNPRPHSEHQQAQPHLSSPQSQQHPRPHHPLLIQQVQLQAEQSPHQLQNQLGQPNLVNQQHPIMPVATPSSMLNLGRLGGGSGGRLGSALAPSTSTAANVTSSSAVATIDGGGITTRAKKVAKASKDGGGSSTGGATSRKRSLTTSTVGSGMGVGVSPGLKPLRPATVSSESTLPSPALTGSVGPSSKPTASVVSSMESATGSTGGGSVTATPALSPTDGISVIRQPKRTHRDAEQRRRNSQKQVIDELRRLLPPIALPSDSNGNNNGDSDPTSPSGPTPGASPFFFQPIATLLPGGLPPRGPPKAGGEGPNKNVSKLQVLLCGNEYIKLLKGRVERRDDEIGRLRREVRRLRSLRGGGVGLIGGGEMRREEEVVDLEKDLDAIERLNTIGSGNVAGPSGGRSSVQGGNGGGEDAMDEDDDDGDD